MTKPTAFPSAEDPKRLGTRLIQGSWNRDGLPEIAGGLTLLLASGFIYAQAVLPHNTPGFKMAVISFAILLPVLMLSTQSLLKGVRARFLLERSGYVQYKPMARKYLGAKVLIGLAMALLFFVAARLLPNPDRWLIAFTGLLGGSLQVWVGLAIGLRRFVLYGACWALTGALLAYSGIPLGPGMAILYGLQGAVSLISGAVVFGLFLRRPVEEGGPNER
jgi:hypothetical protein